MAPLQRAYPLRMVRLEEKRLARDRLTEKEDPGLLAAARSCLFLRHFNLRLDGPNLVRGPSGRVDKDAKLLLRVARCPLNECYFESVLPVLKRTHIPQ